MQLFAEPYTVASLSLKSDYRGPNMKRSADRILTTHVGSLPRPKELLDLMRNMLSGRGDDAEFADQLHDAVSACVREQVDHGLDVVNDGEQGKMGFSRYIHDRLDGFESRPRPGSEGFAPEVEDFPEYYEQYFRRAMMGGAIAPASALICTGPIQYVGQQQVERDIQNLKAATRGSEVDDVFMSAVAPSGVGKNEYYNSDEEYFFALADALKTEYRAIVDAGFVLQVDDPFLAELYSYSGLPPDECRERAELFVAATNRALDGISADRVRYHTCYGINEGPRVHDAPLKSFIDLILEVNAGAYSFEAANARHAHEYHVWESVKLPPEKVLLPGVITQGSNIVEHPEVIAERIVNFARIVGRERVIASADCGFSSPATYNLEVHPRAMWDTF